jgi:hypothetical protein
VCADRRCPCIQLCQVLCRSLYQSAADRPMWRLHSGRVVKLTEGYFLQPMSSGAAERAELGENARRWIMQQLPLFDVPYEVRALTELYGQLCRHFLTTPMPLLRAMTSCNETHLTDSCYRHLHIATSHDVVHSPSPSPGETRDGRGGRKGDVRSDTRQFVPAANEHIRVLHKLLRQCLSHRVPTNRQRAGIEGLEGVCVVIFHDLEAIDTGLAFARFGRSIWVPCA